LLKSPADSAGFADNVPVKFRSLRLPNVDLLSEAHRRLDIGRKHVQRRIKKGAEENGVASRLVVAIRSSYGF
jgi:hypothetical protein